MAAHTQTRNDIATLSAKLASSLSAVDKIQQTKSLEYIIQLAALTNTNISEWDIFELFTAGQGKILVDKKEINKRFFERKSEAVAAATASANRTVKKFTAMPELAAKLEEFSAVYLKNQERNIKRQLDDWTENVKRCFAQTEQSARELAKFRAMYDGLRTTSPADVMKKELAEVLAEGSWTNPVFYENCLYLNTKNNVSISCTNKAAGIDIRVDCGQLAVKIDLGNLYMRVIPYKNNLDAQGFYHPHVNREGGICWGDAGNQVSDWMGQGRIGEMLKILYSLLFNYNERNPYIAIQHFVHTKKYGRIHHAILKHPEKMRSRKSASTTPSDNQDESEEAETEA